MMGNGSTAASSALNVVPKLFEKKIFEIGEGGTVTLDHDILSHLGASPGSKLNVQFVSYGRIELRIIPSSENGPDIGPKAWDDNI